MLRKMAGLFGIILTMGSMLRLSFLLRDNYVGKGAEGFDSGKGREEVMYFF